MARVLITGSRDWLDRGTIESELFGWWIDVGMPKNPVLISLSYSGADAIAEQVWLGQGYPIESYPNTSPSDVVSTGADVCFAFIKDKGIGSSITADLAERSGIRTIRITK